MDGGLATGFGGGLYSTQAGLRFGALAGGVGLPIESSGPPPVSATLAVTLAAKTLASTATVGVSATLAHTLAAKTVAATATVGVSATLAVTLGAKTVAATATVTTPGGGSGGAAWIWQRRHSTRRRFR